MTAVIGTPQLSSVKPVLRTFDGNCTYLYRKKYNSSTTNPANLRWGQVCLHYIIFWNEASCTCTHLFNGLVGATMDLESASDSISLHITSRLWMHHHPRLCSSCDAPLLLSLCSSVVLWDDKNRIHWWCSTVSREAIGSRKLLVWDVVALESYCQEWGKINKFRRLIWNKDISFLAGKYLLK